MSYPPVGSSRSGKHTTNAPSPLRHASNISNTSSETSVSSHHFPPSRNSTVSSATSYNSQPTHASLKRPLRETSPSKNSPDSDYHYSSGQEKSPPQHRSDRPSLRPLSQAPNVVLNPSERPIRRPPSPERTEDMPPGQQYLYAPASSEDSTPRQTFSVGVGRSDSMRAKPAPSGHAASNSAKLETSDFRKLGTSATGHLRALSKFAEQGEENNFAMTSPEQEVAGMHGRMRLQRNMSTRGKRANNVPGYGGRTWMDTQRQFLQAYEYLCHIGEAKEWIEDITHKPLPPIVQLEEALRDGVALAEIVQALRPQKPLRIFRNPRLQFRHSDNIAIFFRYLADIELPELFRFELVDLYERKNIPKVIYCIHALSWLLLRKGLVDFRIGNLVGQLEFEHHELEATQKGLDKSGVSMPNFSGMSENFGAESEPPPEPEENEDERIGRELREQESTIVELQAQLSGALLRIRLGDTMQDLWDDEEFLVDLQSRIRGDFARQILEYRLHMRRFAVGLQSLSRGFVVRNKQHDLEDIWRHHQNDILALQSHLRAKKPRQYRCEAQMRLQKSESSLRNLQAAVRGATCRWNLTDDVDKTRKVEPSVIELQRKARGMLFRLRYDERQKVLQRPYVQSRIGQLQAGIRRMQTEKRIRCLTSDLAGRTPVWMALQAKARGKRSRELLLDLRAKLQQKTKVICAFQSLCKGSAQRHSFFQTKSALQRHEQDVIRLQSVIRGSWMRRTRKTDLKNLHNKKESVLMFQYALRGYRTRSEIYGLLCQFNKQEHAVIELQTFARAMLLRSDVASLLEYLESQEQSATELQAAMRAQMVRKRFAEKRKYYRENMQRVVKVQSFVRARQQGDAYKSLTSGKNPPVNTVKNFVHLLNDSDFDFDEEVESEKLRKAVGTKIRENEQTEQWIAELDAKIGLLAHNKIARDEYAKHYGGYAGTVAARKSMSTKDSLNLKALNKNSRAKLELYQELFCILQTETQYLARMFCRMRDRGTNDEEHKRLEMLVMSTYGFAQKRREEYYLLNLISAAIREESDSCPNLSDFMRGSFFFGKLFNKYTQAPRDRRYFRDVLGSLVRSQIIENEGLDLESDPLQIYRAAINDEELRTGQRSRRNPDLPREQAIRDPETREIFIRHLQDLRDLVDQFLIALDDSLPKLPYGARFVAKHMFETLSQRYPRENPERVLQLVGNWLYKTYLKPAMAEPEKAGAVDRGLDSIQRRNLSEFVKVIGQVAAGKFFGDENVYLQPLNSYVDEAIGRMNGIWSRVIDVAPAEEIFEIDVMDDIHARNPPTLFIKMSDVFAMHHLVASHVSGMCLSHEDNNLREVIRDLGNPKNNEAEMAAGSSEVTLSLSGKLHNIEDPDADIKALYMETKRCVLYIIRIQAGDNLMDIMVRPISPNDESRWAGLVHEELALNNDKRHRKQRAYTSGSTEHGRDSNLADLASMSYAELKGIALENILALEARGRISRLNNYQDLLNEIAIDIRQKHKRRQQRRRELDNVRATLAALDDKASWLEEKLKAYNDTFEQNLNVLQNKKGKKRFIMPFSTQWNHERELARLGRVPQYGSYKYSADVLLEKGILVEWRASQAGHQSLRDLDVTISSDEVNVFLIEGSAGSLMLPGASATFTWDDLLEAQYQGQKLIRFFGEDEGGKSGQGRHGGPRTGGSGAGLGELVMDARLFMQQVSKKFWPEG